MYEQINVATLVSSRIYHAYLLNFGKTFKYTLEKVTNIMSSFYQKNESESYPILGKGIQSCYCCCVCMYVTLRGLPLYSETGWTGELWSKPNLLK